MISTKISGIFSRLADFCFKTNKKIRLISSLFYPNPQIEIKRKITYNSPEIMKIAIVDDDEKCLSECISYVAKYNEEMHADMSVDTYRDGFEFTERNSFDYDIVIMDIEMPKMNGLEAAKKLRDKDSVVAIIFITNMAQYAIKGYEVNAIDYIVKPVPYFTFKSKIEKAIQYCQKHIDYDFTISTLNGMERIQVSSIYYIAVLNHSLSIHTTSGTIEVSGSLSKMEEKLKNMDFSRCNSCYLVNLRHVAGFKDDMIKVGDDYLPISRSKKKAFLNDLISYRGAMR